MRTNEELRAKHSENRYPRSPPRLCPSCFLIDDHASPRHKSQCAECNRWSDEGFPVAGSHLASAMVLEAVREAIAGKDQRALSAWKIISDDWEWKK